MFKEVDISCEKWREYVDPRGITYRISNPQTLFLKQGSESHRILDKLGIYHYIPLELFPIIRWSGKLIF